MIYAFLLSLSINLSCILYDFKDPDNETNTAILIGSLFSTCLIGINILAVYSMW